MADQKKNSLRAEKGHMTRHLKEAEGVLDSLMQYKSSLWQEKVDKIWDKIEARLEVIQKLCEELQELDPTQATEANNYAKQLEDVDKKVMAMAESIAKTRKDLAKMVNTSAHSNQEDGNNEGCRPNKELKPTEELQLQDNPVKVRRWKEEFKGYYTASNMHKAKLQVQHSYFLKCLAQGLRDKVSKKIENLPIYSSDGGVDTCYTVIDSVFLQEYPLVKRRQEFFELTQQGQKTSEFVDKLEELMQEADIEKLKPRDHIVFRTLQGMTDKDLKEKLLEQDNLDFDKMKKVIAAAESAKSCLVDFGKKSSSYGAYKGAAPSSYKKNTDQEGSQKNCSICNRGHKGTCRFPADIICKRCDKKGHIVAACPEPAKTADEKTTAGKVTAFTVKEEIPPSMEEKKGTQGGEDAIPEGSLVDFHNYRTDKWERGRVLVVQSTPRGLAYHIDQNGKPRFQYHDKVARAKE